MISIITTSWNSWKLTAKFLQNIYTQFGSSEYELIIVDNASSSNIRPKLENQRRNFFGSERMKLIFSDTNLGFGGGNNLGAKEASGDILLFTQTDVVFYKNLLPVVEDNCTDNTLVGTRLIDFDSGWNSWIIDGNRYCVPYIQAHCMWCKRSVWKALGGFDTLYNPADFEDVDLSMQAAVLDISLWGVDGVEGTFFHHNQGSVTGKLPNRESMTRKHRELFYKKWGDNMIRKYGRRI